MIAYSGTFDSVDKARSAVTRLGEEGFASDDVLLLEPASGDALQEKLTSGMKSGFITSDTFKRTSDALEGGKPVVVVKAGYGKGKVVDTVFEATGAKLLGASSGAEAPNRKFISEVFGFSLLVRYHPGAGVVFSGSPHLTGFLGPLVVRPKAERSSSFGMPLLAKPWLTGGLMPLLTNFRKYGSEDKPKEG